MATATGLPVFAYIEERQQAADLRDFMRRVQQKTNAKAAPIPDDILPDMADEISFLVANVGIFANLNESELSPPLNSLVSLIVPLAPNRVSAVVRDFCERLCEREFEGAKAGPALRVLSNLFYGFGNEGSIQALQYDIYCAMIKLAGKSGQMAEIPTDPQTLKEWFATWKIDGDVSKVRNVFRLLHEGLSAAPGTEAQALIIIELLKTYQTEAEAVAAIGDARECVRGAMAEEGTFVFDHLLSLRPVQALERGDPLTYKLLQICVSGSVDDYLSFYASSQSHVTEALKLDHAALTYKMRILSLMSLGEERQEIKLDDLSKALKLSGEDLEEFVIEAIQAGAVKARIDQVGGKIIILGVKHRRFERKQWEQLKAKLDAWEFNLTVAKKHLDAVTVQ